MATSLTLSSSARLALIGLSYIYIVKLIDTLWHGIRANPVISFVVVCLTIIAGIAQFLFFCKLKTSTSNSGILADNAGWIGVVGSLINILPKILALLVLLQFYFSLSLSKNTHLIAVLSPWLASVMLFVSCLLFCLFTAKIGKSKTRFFLFGFIGYLVIAATLSTLVLSYFSGAQVNWQVGEVGMSLEYFIVSASFSFLCIAYFYAGFLGGNEGFKNDRSY